ncbi:hypothetical protein [Roseomonas sp. HF4]|uniref:hypothetical protein n=1 Tax=Roseomonas sp. HF4 TaxID=2562313 RepID=UPI0010C111DC|nr:hypothetical protein [Roseomonas sp. HF4]
MRGLILLLLAILPGCGAVGAPGAPLLAGAAVVEGVALRAFGRTTGDAIVSLVTGEDCSITRIGRGEAYCDPNLPPPPQPVCTRSLGAVDCWTVPPAAWPPYRGVADGPATLTEAQENLRIGWPRRLLRAATPPETAPAAEPVTPVAVIAPAAPLPAETPPPTARPEPAPRPAARARPAAAQTPAARGSPPVPVIEPAPLPPGPGAGTTAAAAAAAAIARPASAQPDGRAVPFLPRAAEGGDGGGDLGGAGQR